MEVEEIIGEQYDDILPLPVPIDCVTSVISSSNTVTNHLWTNTTSESSSNEAETRSDSASSPIALVAKPGTKSAIWGYFGLKPDTAGKPIDNGQDFATEV